MDLWQPPPPAWCDLCHRPFAAVPRLPSLDAVLETLNVVDICPECLDRLVKELENAATENRRL